MQWLGCVSAHELVPSMVTQSVNAKVSHLALVMDNGKEHVLVQNLG